MSVRLDVPEARFADIGGPVHFLEWQGPAETTFVCVHGLGGAHVNWLSVAPGMSRLGRVLALDLPGFGRTPRAGRACTLTAHRRVLSRFLREEATGRVILAGNSMGGTLALSEAAFEPELVHRLVLTDPALPWAWRAGVPSAIAIGAFALYSVPGLGEWAVRQRLNRLSPELIVAFGFRVCAADAGGIDPDVVRAHTDLMRERRLDPDTAPAFVETARSLLSLGRRPELRRWILDAVRCPVLMLHGGRDRLVPVGFARAAARGRPRWRLRVLEDLGHIPQLEAPKRWLDEVERFLEEPIPAT